MKLKSIASSVVAATALMAGASSATAAEELTVAYFLEWPSS